MFETHFHADFVSGHLDLAEKTGAEIVYGPTAKPAFEAIVAEDNQVFEVGKYKVKVIHTPGHTMESTTYLLIDESGNEHGIITGDTLFIGDVGRPDLAQHVIADLTEEKLASHLFDSLRNKIMPLSDDLIVYPNHGAGSACGKKMSKETTDTLGNQKATNYALRADMTREEFIKELLTGLTTPPGYFPKNVLMNIKGYDSIDKVMERGMRALSPREFEAAANETGALLLDTRDPADFAKGFLPLLGNKDAIGEAFHITSDEVLTWNQAYEEVGKALGVDLDVVHIASDLVAKYDEHALGSLIGDKVNSVVFDNSKIKRLVPDFECTISWSEGVRRVIDWFEADPARQTVDKEANQLWDRIIEVYERALPS